MVLKALAKGGAKIGKKVRLGIGSYMTEVRVSGHEILVREFCEMRKHKLS